MTQIVTSSIPSQINFIMKLDPPGPTVIDFDDWTETMGICGGFGYEA
jgi:hypothetical protein